jgi:hypothetical protein
LTLLDGDPGQGKSLLAIDVAARLSAALEMPDGHQPTVPAAALFFCAEDGIQDTVIPRLVAAGADLDRIFAWTHDDAETLVFPAGCTRLRTIIQETGARLVVMDPFFAFLGQEVGSLNDLMIRRALGPLAELAGATGAAILLIRHLGKGSVGKQATYRGLGSLAILGVARTAFLIAPDPADPDRRVLACTKNNLAAFPPALGFRITAVGAVARIDWTGPVSYTADDLLQSGRRPGESVPRALSFLQEHLVAGPCQRDILLQQATVLGLSLRTLERAKAQLGIRSEQRREQGRNVWYWRLAG